MNKKISAKIRCGNSKCCQKVKFKKEAQGYKDKKIKKIKL